MSNYKHLLLPTDLTEASEPAADRAEALAELTGAELTVLNVVDYVPPRWVANELPEEFLEIEHKRFEEEELECGYCHTGMTQALKKEDWGF